MGGLARRASKIDTFRRPDHGLIVLNTGDSIASSSAAHAIEAKELRPTAGTIIQALGLMGTDALVPGENELATGLAWLTKEAGHAGLHLLAANLTAKVRGKNPFKARKLMTAGKVKVGLFGLIDLDDEPENILKLLKKSKARQKPALSAAKAQIKALRKEGAEVIVLLAHMSQDKARLLLEQVKGVHLAILGHHGMRLNEPMRMGDTFVMEAGRRGQELGHIQLELGASGLDETPFKDDSRRHTAYWSIQQQLGVLKQLLSTVDPGQEPPAQAVEVNRLVTEQIKKYKEMSPDGGSNTLSASMIPLDDSVQDHPAVAALVNGKKGAAAPSAAAAVHPTKTGPIVGTPMRIPQEVVDEVDRQAAQQRR